MTVSNPSFNLIFAILVGLCAAGCGDPEAEENVPIPTSDPVFVTAPDGIDGSPSAGRGELTDVGTATSRFTFALKDSLMCGELLGDLAPDEVELTGALPGDFDVGSYDLAEPDIVLTVTSMEEGPSGTLIRSSRPLETGELVVVSRDTVETVIQVGGVGYGATAQGQFAIPFCP